MLNPNDQNVLLETSFDNYKTKDHYHTIFKQNKKRKQKWLTEEPVSHDIEEQVPLDY
jgi:hypothetical protein